MFSQETQQKQKRYLMNLDKSLKAEIAQIWSNKLQSVKFEISDEKIKHALKISKFTKVRKRLEKELSKNGRKALVAFEYNGSALITEMNIVDETIVGNEILNITVNGGTSIIINGAKADLYTRFEKRGMGYIIQRFYFNPGEYTPILFQPTQSVPTGVIPVEVFGNNENDTSDIENAEVQEAIKYLKYLGDKLHEAQEYSKAIFANNGNFTDDTAKDKEEMIMNGRRFVDEESFNSKLQQSITLLSPGTGEMALHTATIEYVENKIKIKLGAPQNSMDNGTNKHGLEIVLKDQFQTELLLSKQALRQESFESFFEKLALLLGTTPPEIKVELSPIEQAKMDLLKAEVQKINQKQPKQTKEA